MKRGDRFKVVGRDDDGDTVVEHELDDGAKMHSKIVPLSEAEARDDMADEAEVVVAQHTGGSEFKVIEAKPYRGPTRCNSRAYRDGWEGVFGAKQDEELN